MQRRRLLKGQSMAVVAQLAGLSDEQSEPEAVYTQGWARNIWADMLT